MHSSLTVSDYLLDLDKDKNEDYGVLTPMKLIKLVYLCHGWMLGLYEQPLLVDNVEVWRYGPVVPGLYRAVKKFRSNSVCGPLSREKGEFDDNEKSVMDQVFKIYSRYSGIELSRLTHAPGTPWGKMREDGREIIPNDIIQAHFQGLAQRG